jgi:hypothetical protein
MDEARLFLAAYDFNFNPTGSKNPVKEEIAVSGLSRRAGSDCTQMLNIEALGHMPKTKKGFFGLLNGFFLKIPLAKNILTQAHRQTNVFNCAHPPKFVHFADYHTHGI